MHVSLSYSEFQPVGHIYLNCLKFSWLVFFLQHKFKEHSESIILPIVELFNLERAELFFQSLSSIDSENNSLPVTVDFNE